MPSTDPYHIHQWVKYVAPEDAKDMPVVKTMLDHGVKLDEDDNAKHMAAWFDYWRDWPLIRLCECGQVEFSHGLNQPWERGTPDVIDIGLEAIVHDLVPQFYIRAQSWSV